MVVVYLVEWLKKEWVGRGRGEGGEGGELAVE